ncbi:acetyl-CoA carboxylase [uncultured Alsobacter sp.]|uniref:acetyl-CoA carboxylase n=1 Tax=uncultured Alsobacter sp. TaxID=1748258 RepID=UPI0025D9954B|nr:acetyl-CoA carboxylase [uncultured Alsobacter sp.]
MSVDPAFVAQLSTWLAATDIAVLELRGPDGTLRLVQAGSVVRSEAVSPVEDIAAAEAEVVAAPGVGVFLDRHPLRLEPAAAPGSQHAAGEPLGFLRTGPILQAVSAPCDCIVEGVLAAHGATVGFGTPLVAIVPIDTGETP